MGALLVAIEIAQALETLGSSEDGKARQLDRQKDGGANVQQQIGCLERAATMPDCGSKADGL